MEERFSKNIDNVKVKCLAFADDLALQAETEKEATKQVSTLKDIAEETVVPISYEKTEIMTTDASFSKKLLNTDYGKVKVSKHLIEIICSNGSDRTSTEESLAINWRD
ncbi:uncharacterized protein [Halyomorpha halys]|uniref:uncharacterized protein n=1 Tax=Halyomorpha halys TaxID=286706 RepID=UPI0034D24584